LRSGGLNSRPVQAGLLFFLPPSNNPAQNPLAMNPLRPRTNTDAELNAFDQTCERIAGFDDQFSFERVDGMLCAMAATPHSVEPAEWLPALFGDAFERAFGDPEAQAQAVHALQARLAVLRSELDPEALFDEPDYLRLEPLVAEWDDEGRRKLVEEGVMTEAEAALVQTGVEWAEGFLDVTLALPQIWTLPANEEAEAVFEQSFQQIEALLLAMDSDEYRAHVAEAYPKGAPTRDDLLAEACMAVQDLRMYWVDFAPKTETRRVEATPGRNDPCPCGSGKKYKKCHGIG
jgi:uncharacterized protein